MDQFKLYLQYQKEVSQTTLKIVERFQQQPQPKLEKRTSNIDLVQNIIGSSGRPLHVADIIQLAEKNQAHRGLA